MNKRYFYLFLMNNWEHLSCSKDSIDFKEALIEIFSLLNGLFIIVSFSEFDIEGFVEAVDFVFHGSAKCFDLRFGHPVAVHVASTFIFEEIFELTSGRSDSSPQNLRNLDIKNGEFVILFWWLLFVKIISKLISVVVVFPWFRCFLVLFVSLVPVPPGPCLPFINLRLRLPIGALIVSK